MARPFRIRTGALEDLVEQLVFTRAAAMRQFERLADLALVIEPGRTYPEAWVVRQITGYEPSRDSGVELVGAALLGDLSAVTERLSVRVGLDERTLGARVIDAAELRTRWGVTPRTLERDRRAGLLAVRVRRDDGSDPAGTGGRLAYLRRSVEDFEKRGVRGAGASAGVSKKSARLTEAQRERVVREAAMYRRKLGWTLARASARLAERFGVSVQAVRQLLQRRDARASSPTFDDPGPIRGERRRELLEAWRGGAAVSELAKVHHRTATSITRIVNERRAELLRRLEWAGVPDDAGAFGEGIDAPLLGHPAVVAGFEQDIDASLAAFVRAAGELAPDAELEHARAAAYQLLRWQARAIIARLPRHAPGSAALDEAETRLRWATLLKTALMQSVQGIAARAVAERASASLDAMAPGELARWRRAAIEAAAWGVDHYDPFSGGRLAAPVSVSLARSLAAVAHERTAGTARRATATESDDNWPRHVSAWQPWLDPPARVLQAVRTQRPSPPAARALALRFGLTGERPRTAAELRRDFAVSPQRLAHWVRLA